MSVVAQRTKGTSEDEMTLAEIFAEMKRLRELMDRDQRRIDRLKAESNAIKLETQVLKMQTRVILDDLKSMVKPC